MAPHPGCPAALPRRGRMRDRRVILTDTGSVSQLLCSGRPPTAYVKTEDFFFG